MIDLVYNALIFSIVGGTIFYLKSVCSWCCNFIRNRTVVSIVLREEGCDYFTDVLKHVTTKQLSKSAKQLELTNRHLSSYRYMNGMVTEAPKDLTYIPAIGGEHHFVYHGKRIYVSTSSTVVKQRAHNERSDLRRLSFWMYGRSTDLLKEYIEHAIDEYKKENIETISVKRARRMTDMWMPAGNVSKRPKETVVLKGTMMNDIIEDIATFRNGKEWYKDRGIPHRRGYLLYGQPGSGKTSTIRCLASECDLDMHVLSMSSPFISDDIVHSLISSCTNGSMLVIEDVDAIFRSDKDKQQDRENLVEMEPGSHMEKHYGISRKEIKNSKVTLSGLLNSLDGVDSGEGFITVMTTNFPERLDPALTRPGRVDKKYEFSHPDTDQLERMYKIFFPEGADAKEFARAITASEILISMASIQGYFLLKRDNEAAVLDGLEEFIHSEQ